MSGIPARRGDEHSDVSLALYEEERIDEETSATSENGATEKSVVPVSYVETEDESELRSLIFTTSDVEERLIDVPEWRVPQPDGTFKIVQVLLRSLPASERLDFIKRRMAAPKEKDGRPLDLKPMYFDIAMSHARHPVTKKLLFKPGDRDELLKKNGKAIERIALSAIDLSGLDDSFVRELKKR